MAEKEKKQKIDMQQYMDFQLLNQQLKEIQQRLQTVEAQSNEILVIKEALSDLGKVKKGNDILAPIAPGIFVKAKLDDSKNVVVNVGSKVVVSKTADEVGTMLDSQMQELRAVEQTLAMQFQQVLMQIEDIQSRIQE